MLMLSKVKKEEKKKKKGRKISMDIFYYSSLSRSNLDFQE
jgi:hypothetical protein